MKINNKSPIRNLKIRIIVSAAVLVVVIAGLAIGYIVEKNSHTQERGVIAEDIGVLNRVDYEGATYIEKPAITTLLLLGVDKTSTDSSYGARQGGQSDFIMVIAIDHGNKTLYQLQIDRDTMTNVKIYGILGNELGTRIMQICLAHGFGATQEENDKNAVDAVQNFLQGIQIDYFISLDLESIGVLNDALGGVTVTLADDFTAYDPLMTQGKTIRLNAVQAEIFTRYRLEVGDGSNESRMTRQKTFMSAAGELLKARITTRTDFVNGLFDQLQGVMTTNLSKGQLANEVNTAYNYKIMPVEVLAGEHKISENGFMENYVAQDAVIRWILQVFYEPDV